MIIIHLASLFCFMQALSCKGCKTSALSAKYVVFLAAFTAAACLLCPLCAGIAWALAHA